MWLLQLTAVSPENSKDEEKDGCRRHGFSTGHMVIYTTCYGCSGHMTIHSTIAIHLFHA